MRYQVIAFLGSNASFDADRKAQREISAGKRLLLQGASNCPRLIVPSRSASNQNCCVQHQHVWDGSHHTIIAASCSMCVY